MKDVIERHHIAEPLSHRDEVADIDQTVGEGCRRPASAQM